MNIPNSIEKFYDYFAKIGLENQEKKPIVKKHLDIEPFNHPEITKSIECIWFVGETDEIRVWIIQTEKWDRKTWRNIIIRKLRNSLNTQILFFIPINKEQNETIQEYSLSVIMTEDEGVIDIPSMVPSNPNIRTTRFWEAIEENTLEDMVVFNATASQIKHKLTAKELLTCLKNGDENSLVEILEKNGLKILKENIILPRKNTPLKEAVLKIKINETINDYNRELAEIRDVYREYIGDSPEWVIFLEKEKITYFSFWEKEFLGAVKFTDNDVKNNDILTTLIAIVDRRSSFNSETFSSQFGIYSPIFIKAQKKMMEYLEENYEDYRVLYEEWQRFFQEVYRAGDTDKNLFVKHSYLSLLIRITLMMKYLKEGDIEREAVDKIVNYFEERGVSIFGNDFFRWVINVKEVRTDLFFALKDAIFDADDIFRTIYQQMVSPETRQALGEFYTPPELAKLMVDETYKLGEKVLDPACGSGTFLVEIIKIIKDSNIKDDEKINALNCLYGFDVNPIAVSVAKANILLQISELIQDEANIPVQIFLCNSLFPLERNIDADVQFGRSIIFHLHAINKKIPLNVAFFNSKYENSFANALRKLDSLMLKDYSIKNQFVEEVSKLVNRKEFEWMNQEIPDAITNWDAKNQKWTTSLNNKKSTLKDNFFSMANEFYNLSKKKSNHIWIYLLYNSLGVDQVKNSIDLCIGNPPWLVLNNIHSKEYKNKIKELAKKFDIMPLAESITHLEISALFLSACNKYYLKNNGKLFFVLSYGFVSGSNHDATRKFDKFDNLQMWTFSDDLFNIHNLCFYAEKNSSLKRKPEEIEVLFKKLNCIRNKSTNEIEISLEDEEVFVPYEIQKLKGKTLIKKFVSKNVLSSLLPRGDNPYIKNVYAGANIVPRKFFFIEIVEQKNNTIIVKPKEMPYIKKQWSFNPYITAEIENEYIFNIVKSTEIIPFAVLSSHKAFLPIEFNDFQFYPNKIKPYAKKHFDLLQNLYKKHQKRGASITNLWNQINHMNKLIANRQKSEIKVVTNQIGSIVKAAVIKSSNPIIVDYSLYLIAFDSLDEAYYYSAILNSPCITSDVQKRASTGAGGGVRNLMMRPHEYLIPKFDSNNNLHIQIKDLGKELEEQVWEIANKNRKDDLNEARKKSKSAALNEMPFKPRKIQKEVLKELDSEFKKLDLFVLELLKVKNEV
ncbi:MAG: N-6 DNA methylase [Candidatus Heimdallarchaeota archaeon]